MNRYTIPDAFYRGAEPTPALQGLFLRRLERLIRLKREYGATGDLNLHGLRLMDVAIDATYRDCIDFGWADAARPVMAAHRRRQWEGQK